MDILLAHTLYKKQTKATAKAGEKFRNYDDDEEDDRDRRDDRHRRDYVRRHRYDDEDDVTIIRSFKDLSLGAKIFQIVLSVLCIVVAAYLSWTSNTVAGYNIALKLVFAALAALFGFFYIVSHIIFKLDLLGVIKASRGMPRVQAGGRRR